MEERTTANLCQGVNSNNVLQKQFSEEVVKPTRRSTRIRKPKTSTEFSKKDVIKSSEALVNVELPKQMLTELTSPISCKRVNKSDMYDDFDIPKASTDLETGSALFQIENGEGEIAAMFDDIFEPRYSQSVQSLLPKHPNDSLEERKIFKRNSLETPSINFSSYIYNRSNLPTEDVSKVFKIISKPNPLPDLTCDLKPSTKSALKTYANKRKSFQKTDVIESFGLPDHPIVPEIVQPPIDDELDVTIEDANEITILDMEYVNDPWVITTEGEDLLPIVDEIRRKSEPAHNPFKKNGSFSDISDSFEIIMEPTIISSTPFSSRVCDEGMSVCIENKNTDTNNEISIGAMKMNFKKILNRTNISTSREKFKRKSKSLPKKKNSVVAKRNIFSINKDILLVEDDSLTVDNKEFELSDNWTVPKSNRVRVSKKNKKTNPIYNKRGPKITRKRLRSLMHSDEEKEHSEKSKNEMNTLSENQNLLSAADIKESVGDIVPKTILETDSINLKSKCSSPFSNIRRRKSTQKIINSNKKSNQTKNGKRVLRSSLQNPVSKNTGIAEVKNDTRQNNIGERGTSDSEKVNKKRSDSESKKHNLVGTVRETEKIQTLKRNVKHLTTSQVELGKNKDILKTKLSRIKRSSARKKVLRSTDHDFLELGKSSTTASSSTKNLNQQKSHPKTSNLMNTVEKYKHKGGVDAPKKENITEISAAVEEIPQKKKATGNPLTTLKKGNNSFSEIKIVLEPIDISKINEKLQSDTKKILCGKSYLTKRKTHLVKTTTKTDLDIDNRRNSVVKCGTTKNEKSVVCNSSNSALISAEKNIETSKAELRIEENSVTSVEDKKSFKTMEKIINKTDSQKIIVEVKSKKSSIKSKEIKSTRIDTDVLHESKTENDSFTNSNGGTLEELEKPEEKPLPHCSETPAITQDPTDNIKNIEDNNLAVEGTTETLVLERDLNGHIDKDAEFIEQCNSAENKKEVEKTNSSEFEASNVPLEHVKDTSENCDLTKSIELVQTPEIHKEFLSKSDEKDEDPISKCNLKEKDLAININESQKVCNKETLKTTDIPLEDNQEFLLGSENKINLPDSNNSKVEKPSLSNLLKKEEDKTIINTSLIDKVEPPKCLANQNELLSAESTDTSKNLPVDEFKNLDPSSDSKIILDVISDKTKEDLMIDFRIFTDNSFEEIVNIQDNTSSDESTQALDTGLEQNEKENNKPVTSVEQNQIAEIHDQASLESISSILTTENASGEEISSSLSQDEEYSASHIESITSLSSEPEIKNDSSSVIEPEEHNETNAKLPEKRRSRSLSCDESTKKHENISVDSSHVVVTKKEFPVEHKTTNMNLTYPLTNLRKRGRPRKSNSQLSQPKSTPKQEAIDDMNLLNRYKVFVNRQHSRPRGRPRKESLDDMDLLNRYKKYSHSQPPQPRDRPRRKSLDNLDILNKSKELVQQPRPRGRPRKIFTHNMDLFNKSKEHADDIGQPRPRGIPRKKSLENTDLLNKTKELSDDVQQPRPRGRPRRKSLDCTDFLNASKEHADNVQQPRPTCELRKTSVENTDLLNKTKENTDIQSPRPRGRPRRKSVDDMDLLNRYKEHTEKKKRSKSVARSMLEIRRKPNARERWRSSDDWISSHTRNKDSPDDNMNLLSRYQKYKDQMQNKNAEVTVKLENQLNNEGSPKKPKTDVKKSIVKRDVYVPAKFIKENDFKVGDITWAQIGSHPYWPCLITKEPGKKYYKKIFQNKRFLRELYHVRFFGDKGRRAWIRKHQLLRYSNQDDLKVLRDKIKSENKLIPSIYSVKVSVLPKWQTAVNEAEQLKLKNVKDRLRFFTEMFLRKRKKSTSEDTVVKSSPVPAKRKSNENVKTEDESFSPQSRENSLEIIPEKKPKRNDVDNLEKEAVEDGTVNQAEHIDNVQETESILKRMSLRRQIDETSEIESKTSSDNITDIDVSLSCMEAQKALYKRNNLFKGISRDKVCQYCCKPGEVLKCRGRCNGLYHVSCSLKILLEKPARGRRKKNHNDGRLTENKVFHSIKCENSNSPNSDNRTENKGENYNPLVTEDQVQIITVPSSVYNTPPRKTFPPDFKNMTLAEQIDYKMKEIMRKFEYKTVYTDTCTEPVSEESSSLQALSQAVRICSANTSFVSVSKAVNVSSLSENSRSGNRDDKQMDKKLQALAKKKLFIRHVTADSENVKSDTSLEESFDSLEVDPKNFKCGFCSSDLYPYCFVCHKAVSKKGSSIRQRCSIYQCGRFYHPECLKVWPQTQWSLIQTTRHKDTDEDMDSFVCPLHVCHTCVSDDPRAATSRCSGDKIVKCLRCPSTYHSSNLCVPAGTAILSSSQIMCPRHREKSKLYTINTTWCFLCSEGGNLICCETCPTSVHPECLPVNLTDDDKFICEDCESGRLPLYDEIVWVKLGKFRWWPALILFPNEVPDNVRNMKHNIGEFVVKFFGTYDYYWVNRGRSFLFQEGDTGQCNSVRKKVDVAFNRAVEEAVVAHKLKKEFKLNLEVEPVTSLKPPPYIRIKVNRPVGNVRHMDLDLSSTNACECDPNKPHPCGPESDCLNRLLLTECNPEVCPAGTRCKNQSFEKREYPPLVPYKTQGRGWGLKTLAPIKKGQFVIEYVGELIDIEEYQRRIQKMHKQKEENYYFLTIDKDRIIDAGPKGNAARFMNHCCQPNCETQKWTVNGDTRVGLFATVDIPADTELTFNYNLECVGKEKKVCRCGAPNCSGFIGVKAKQDTETRKPKKYIKKKVFVEPVILPPCFICGKEGLVISCNNKICNKTYHQKCLKSTTEQAEGKFICPWHNCNVCSKRTIRCCVKCINSYCPLHSDGNIRYDNLLGFVCTTHDSTTSADDVESVTFKRKRSDSVTEESAVTSTTSEETDDGEDGMSLLERLSRLERFNSKLSASTDVESDNESIFNRPSTSVENQFIFDTDYESQDESVVSSATVPEVGEGVVVKRKRGRPRKRDQLQKKIRLSQERNPGITASHDSSSELTCRENNLENR